MEKLNENEIKMINENMIEKETEKAILLKVNYINNYTGDEKVITMWIPKTCLELSGCGILKMKDWFKKNKEIELKGRIEPVLNY